MSGSIYDDIRMIINGYLGLVYPVYNEGLTEEDPLSIGVKVRSTNDISPHENYSGTNIYDVMILVGSEKPQDARTVSLALSEQFNRIKRAIHPDCGIFAIYANKPILMRRLVGGGVIYSFGAAIYKK